MTGIRWLFAIGIAALLLGGCKPGAVKDCNDADKKCQQKAVAAHAIKSIASWRAELEKPMAQRVSAAPASLLEFLTLDNQLQGFAERPVAPKLDAEFLTNFMDALNEIPPDVLNLVDSRLVGIRFVANLGGTGLTDFVYDSDGRVAGAFVVFDSSVLQSMTANKWATWKERMPFIPVPGYSLDAQIETAALDTRKNAIQYILLHELGHVVSAGRNIHPNWNKSVQQLAASPDRFPFFETTWRFDAVEGTFWSKYDHDFPQRRDVVYYGVARIPGSSMGPTYASLEQTSFATLYSATRPADDFAEAFANYVHVVKLHRPWQIVLEKDGKAIKTIQSCWDETRCGEKRKLIEELIGS